MIVVADPGQSKSPEAKRKPVVRTVDFGDTCQDINSALGCPNKVFYKSEDKVSVDKCVETADSLFVNVSWLILFKSW